MNTQMNLHISINYMISIIKSFGAITVFIALFSVNVFADSNSEDITQSDTGAETQTEQVSVVKIDPSIAELEEEEPDCE